MNMSGSRGASTAAQKNASVVPIALIAPYRRETSLKVRIIEKSEPRTWNNAKGTGTLFSVILMDSNADTVQGRFFTDGYDKYFNVLQLNKTYIFSNGKFQVPQRASATTSEYEATYDANSIIEEIPDDGSIPMYSTKKVRPLDSIATEKDLVATYDFLCVIQSSTPATSFSTKKGTNSTRRELTVVDKSEMLVNLTLWGDIATKYTDEQFKPGDVVLMNGLKINEYNGSRSLQSSFQTSFTFKPTDTRSQQLLQWYNKRPNHNFTSLRDVTGGNDGQPREKSNRGRTLLSGVDEEELCNDHKFQNGDTKVFINFMGVMTRVMFSPNPGPNGQTRLPFYPACVQQRDGRQCGKRVNPSDSNQWTCDQCNVTSAEVEYKYVGSVQVADESDSKWVSVFGQVGTDIFGKTANECAEIYNNQGPEALSAFFESLANVSVNLLLVVSYRQNHQGQSLPIEWKVAKVHQLSHDSDKHTYHLMQEIQHFKKLNQDAGAMKQ